MLIIHIVRQIVSSVLICYSIQSPFIHSRIDNEVDRLGNIGLWRQKEAEKQKKWIEKEPSFPEGFDFNSATEFQPNSDASQKIQMRKDRRMAREDPARYCADRCVSTGNCQVWEDMFELSAKEVMAFCEGCVLSEDEEPCDIPEKFIENAGKNSWELKPQLMCKCIDLGPGLS